MTIRCMGTRSVLIFARGSVCHRHSISGTRLPESGRPVSGDVGYAWAFGCLCDHPITGRSFAAVAGAEQAGRGGDADSLCV